ncbi:amidohydrolase family protein [Herbiconiux sp. P18]|uniref:amidohydrolase family protein n=1 Tax=Herbiconiux liangxiaofengii TaxID=3342795 RepID=UPI0035B91E4C
MTARRLIDAHAHVWTRGTPGLEWLAGVPELDRDFALAEYPAPAPATRPETPGNRRVSGRTGRVAGVVLVQAVNSEEETRELLAAAREPGAGGGDVREVVGWVDLGGADPAGRIEQLRAAPGGEALAGIRHLAHVEPDAEWLVRERTSRGLDAVARAGLAFDLVVRPWQLATAARAVDAHPELQFVLDHLGQPPSGAGAGAGAEGLAHWERGLRALAERPNVAAKVSGIARREPDAVERARLDHVFTVAFEAFGPARLMYGSDWPLVLLADGHDAWTATYLDATAGLSSGEQRDIDGRTALRAYRAETTQQEDIA